MRYRAAFFVIATMLVMACNPDEGLQQKTIATATYVCEDGSNLFVQFKPSSAWIDIGNGQMLTLPQKKVASGIHYASAQQELRGKGSEAVWVMGRRAPTKCKAK